MGGVAIGDIARVVATTSGNVRVLRHRALAELRGHLDRDRDKTREVEP